MPSGMLSAAMRTARVIADNVHGRGARHMLIPIAATAATQPGTKPKRPAMFFRALISRSSALSRRGESIVQI